MAAGHAMHESALHDDFRMRHASVVPKARLMQETHETCKCQFRDVWGRAPLYVGYDIGYQTNMRVSLTHSGWRTFARYVLPDIQT